MATGTLLAINDAVQAAAGSSAEVTIVTGTAAYVAGVVAVLKAAEPGLRTRHLLRFARREGITPAAEEARDASLERTLVRKRRLAPAPLERADEWAELLPAPKESAPALEAPHWTKGRVWWTPNRAQLAALVRGER